MKDPANEATRWLLQADDDLKFVEWLAGEGVFFDKGCFIAQQAGEKALKACLYASGQRTVLGHSLFEMVHELARNDVSFQKVESAAKKLDRYYIPTRYPNGLPGGSPFQTYTFQDLEDALKDVHEIFAAAREFLAVRKRQRRPE